LATTCCGEHTTDKPAQPQKTDHIVAGGCCTKFPAQPNPATLSLSSNTHITKGVAFGLLPISDGSPSQHLAVAVCRQRQDHERPPPTDLVIALQHFLI